MPGTFNPKPGEDPRDGNGDSWACHRDGHQHSITVDTTLQTHQTVRDSFWIINTQHGSQRNLEAWKTWRFEYYLSRSRNSLKLIPKGQKNLDKTRNLAENLDKTWNAKIYKTIFSKFCTPVIVEHLWRLPFGTKIVRNITWRMAFLTWTKPGDNLELFG